MRKTKRLLALLFSLAMAVLCIPLLSTPAAAANINGSSGNQTVVTCFYAQTGENMPRRQYGASSLLANSIRDVEGKGIAMMYVAADGSDIGDIAVGSSLTSSKIKMSNNGKPMWAYCIEHGVSGGNGLDRTVTAENVDQFFNSLTTDAKVGIKAAVLVGFPTSNFGYSGSDAYAATQVLIWEFQTGNRTIKKTSGGLYNGTVLSSSRETQNFGAATKSAYDALVAQVNTFLTDPSIRGSTVTLKWNRANSRYEATLTDSNGVLSNYYLKSSTNSALSASISGNKITLYTTNKNADGVTLTFEHSVLNAGGKTDQPLMILEHPSEQKTLVGTAADPLTFKLTANVEDVGACSIAKVSEDGLVSGIAFKITGPDGFSTTATTNAQGKISLTNLLPGTYTITETAPNQYLQPASKTVTVKSGETVTAAFSNVLKRGDFVALKVDAGTGNPIPEAEFEVFDEYNNLVATAQTDDEGKAVFKDLKYGNYYAFETIAPAGYILSEKQFSFSITENGQVITEIFENENKLHKFSVYKKGETLSGFEEGKEGDKTVFTPVYEEQYLDGAEIGIYAAEDVFTADGTRRFEKDELVDKVVTSKEGPVFTKDLFEGVYYAKEINAPEGFVLNEKAVEVLLFDDNMEITLKNDRQKVSLSFVKALIGSDSSGLSEKLRQVSFGVFNAEQIEALPPNSLLGVIRPDKNGNCVMTADLPCGYGYYIKELGTADGYVLDSNEYEFDFLPADQSVAAVEVTINDGKTLINEPAPKDKVVMHTRTDSPGTAPHTADNLPEEAKYLLVMAAEAMAGAVVVGIRKNKLISYH